MALPVFTQGDYITCVLDMDARTLAFGRNGEDPRVAFEDVDAAELHPCVMFYSSNPGERVRFLRSPLGLRRVLHVIKLHVVCIGICLRKCRVALQVKITDMQVRGAPRTLFPGEPQCAPSPVVLAEALVSLLRELHRSAAWAPSINTALLDRCVRDGKTELRTADKIRQYSSWFSHGEGRQRH